MKSSPCKDCTERHPCCWDSCSKYKEYKAESEKIKQIRRNENAIHHYQVETRARLRRMGKF